LWANVGDNPLADFEPVLYAVGGGAAPDMSLTGQTAVSFLTPSGEWKEGPAMALPRLNHSLVNLDDQIYVIGGFVVAPGEEQRRTRRGEMFDPETAAWYHIKAMEERRGTFGLAVPNGLNAVGIFAPKREIYAIGGFDGEKALETVEKYDVDADTWSFAPPLPNGPCMGGATVVVDEHILVIGGSTGGEKPEILSTVSCFNTTHGAYEPGVRHGTPIPPLPTPRMSSSAAVINGQVYVAGGFTGEEHVDVVERLNPQSGVWQTLAPMSKGRSAAGVAVYKDELYVIGGFDGEERLDTVEKYNYIEDTWSEVTALPRMCQGIAAVTCNRPTPQLPQKTAEWEKENLQQRFNKDMVEKACHAVYADKCEVIVNGGTENGGQGPFTDPEAVAGWFKYQKDAVEGFEKLRYSNVVAKGVCSSDEWTTSGASGRSETVWKQVGGLGTIDDESDDEWKVVREHITFELNSAAQAP